MFLADANIDEIHHQLTKLEEENPGCGLVLMGEEEAPSLEALTAALDQSQLTYMGGIFPGIIYDTQQYTKGCLIYWFPGVKAVHLIPGTPDSQRTFSGLQGQEDRYGPTAFMLTDGLSPNISGMLSYVFNCLGHTVNYLGGGAGSLSLQPAPCLFSHHGVFQDATLLAFLPWQAKLGVRHGWQKVTGPFVATRTNGNLIEELNWQPAYNVYKEVVEQDSGRELTHEGFFPIAKGYPFGIYKEGSEDVVRDPISATPEGGLMCVGMVPENSVLNILKGAPESLVASARQAATDSYLHADKGSKNLIVDCISRVLFLEEDFHRELEAVKEALEGQTPSGILSLGEISSNGEGFLEFFNKTIVSATYSENAPD
ncbi:MAG: FIST C-terminal domain-containing protein [Bacteroidota bacterium]